jgi:hypothetical protein
VALLRFIGRVLISEQQIKTAQDAGCDTDHCNHKRNSNHGPFSVALSLIYVHSATLQALRSGVTLAPVAWAIATIKCASHRSSALRFCASYLFVS